MTAEHIAYDMEDFEDCMADQCEDKRVAVIRSAGSKALLGKFNECTSGS